MSTTFHPMAVPYAPRKLVSIGKQCRSDTSISDACQQITSLGQSGSTLEQ